MRNLKILGLSLLALVGVMAISASAAQAKWLILENLASVDDVDINIKTLKPGKLLVPDLGLAISCAEGNGSIEVGLNEAKTVLSGNGSVTFTSCKDPGFEEVCTVKSVGQGNGTIVAKGTGVASMEGEETFVTLTGEGANPFTDIEYIGEECPLTEIEGDVTGSVSVSILGLLEDNKLKVGHVTKQTLQFGGNKAILEDNELNTTPLFSVTAVSGGFFAAHLVGL